MDRRSELKAVRLRIEQLRVRVAPSIANQISGDLEGYRSSTRTPIRQVGHRAIVKVAKPYLRTATGCVIVGPNVVAPVAIRTLAFASNGSNLRPGIVIAVMPGIIDGPTVQMVRSSVARMKPSNAWGSGYLGVRWISIVRQHRTTEGAGMGHILRPRTRAMVAVYGLVVEVKEKPTI
jgi:hypothetical protein